MRQRKRKKKSESRKKIFLMSVSSNTDVYILGEGNPAPQRVDMGTKKITQVCAKGGRMAAFLSEDGQVFVSGHKRTSVNHPVVITCPEPIRQVSCCGGNFFDF